MGDELKALKHIEHALEMRGIDPEALELSSHIKAVLQSRERNPEAKARWDMGYDDHVKNADKKPKHRYTINAFDVVTHNVKEAVDFLHERNINTHEIQNLLDTILTEIERIKANYSRIGLEILDQIPDDLFQKYVSDQNYNRRTAQGILLPTALKGDYINGALLRAEQNGKDVEINTDIADKSGLTREEIMQRRNTSIQEQKLKIATPYLDEVKNDFGKYHSMYIDAIKNPENDACTTEELVDELERLVDITVNALNKVCTEEKTQEYQEAA